MMMIVTSECCRISSQQTYFVLELYHADIQSPNIYIFFSSHSVTYTDNLKVNLVGVFTAWKQQNISPSLTWKQFLIAHKWIANYTYTMNTKSLNHLNLDSFINYKSIWTPERLWVKVILICWRSVIYSDNNNNKNLEILNF